MTKNPAFLQFSIPNRIFWKVAFCLPVRLCHSYTSGDRDVIYSKWQEALARTMPFGHLKTPYLLGQSLGTHTFGPFRLTQLPSSDLVCAGLKALFCSPIQTIWATHKKNYSSARRPLSPLRLCQQCLISLEKFWFLFPLKGLPADIAVPFQLYNFIM